MFHAAGRAKAEAGNCGDRHKKRTVGMRLDEILTGQLKVLAERNRRTVTMEVTIAIEEYLSKNGLWPPRERLPGEPK